MEDVRNHMNVHLTTNEKKAIKKFPNPLFKNARVNDGLFLIEMLRDKIVMNKPIYVGTSILDISKVCMMKYHYEVMQPAFGKRCHLLHSDTDSVVYEVYTDDIYKWMKQNSEHFDLSDCKQKWLQDNTNKKALGKMKDEMNGLIIKEFTALNPKCYTYTHQPKIEEDKIITNTKKAKGVSKVVAEKNITHEDYLHTLETGETLERKTMRIQSINQQLYTVEQTKKCITTYYDKMQITNNYECVPYGYSPVTQEVII